MQSLIQTIYASDACPGFQEYALPGLLHKARAANARAAVTGVLLFTGESFLQVLEGPATEVDALFARIRFDDRHSNVTRITRQAIAERQFAGDAMNFAKLHPLDAAQLLDDHSMASLVSCTRLNATSAKRLMHSFRSTSRERPVALAG